MSNPYSQAENFSAVPPQKSNTTKILLLVVGGIFLGLFICGGIAAGLILPAMKSAQEAARRIATANNMRMISMAIMNYESAFKQFPPAYTVDAEGNKLHSWRTIVLPMLGQDSVYNSIDFSKPWDAPENSAARNARIPVFDCPSVPLPPGQTLFQAIVDPQGVFTGPKQTAVRDVLDGTTRTILIGQAGKDHAVHWMEPNDMDLPYFLNVDPKAAAHVGGAHVVFVDASILFLSSGVDPESRKSMVTRAGGDASKP